MAVITWTNVTDHAAELSTVAAQAQTDILAYVNSVIQVALIDGEAGPKTKLVRIYLAAHLGELTISSSSSSTTGARTSEKEGDVAVTYASTSSLAAAPHGSTSYGQMYLTLIGTSALRTPVLL